MQRSIIAIAVALSASTTMACKQKARDEKSPQGKANKQVSVEGRAGLPQYRVGDITELDLAYSGKRIIFRRRGDGEWMIIKPTKTRADRRSVEAALRELSRIEGEPGNPGAVTTRREDWARYKVTPEQTVTIRPRAGDRPLPVLHLGRKHWVRVGDAPAVYTAYHISYFTFARPELRLWRDRTLVKLDPAKVTAVEISDGKGNTARAEKKGGTWTLAQGAKQVGALDPSAPGQLVNRLRRLMAYDATSASREAAGLTGPRATIVLHHGGADTTLEIGASKDGFTYVASSDAPGVWKLKDHAAAPLLVSPSQWGKK
jgi:hypothetical protein